MPSSVEVQAAPWLGPHALPPAGKFLSPHPLLEVSLSCFSTSVVGHGDIQPWCPGFWPRRFYFSSQWSACRGNPRLFHSTSLWERCLRGACFRTPDRLCGRCAYSPSWGSVEPPRPAVGLIYVSRWGLFKGRHTTGAGKGWTGPGLWAARGLGAPVPCPSGVVRVLARMPGARRDFSCPGNWHNALLPAGPGLSHRPL